MVPGNADGEIRTAGFDKHNQPQQYCAYRWVGRAQRVGGSIVMMEFVHVVCCLPGIYVQTLSSQLMRTRKQTTILIYVLLVRTYKIRPLVLKPGKSASPLPPGKKPERPPRDPEFTDRGRTSTNVSGRGSRVDYLAFCPESLARGDTWKK